MNDRRKEKLGDFSLDVAKYVLTAILLGTWFSNSATWEWYNFIVPISVVFAAAGVGIYLIGSNNKDKGE